MKATYTIPKLKSYDDLSKTWYVWFRYNGHKVPIKKTGDINRINNYESRLIAGLNLANHLHQELKKGWNPLVPGVTHTHKNMSLSDALDFAMDKKKPNLSHKTYLDYSGTVKFCKEAIKRLNYVNLSISDTKMVHIKTILEDIKASRRWSNKAYNKHLGYLQGILSELIQWYIIPFNPAHKIRPLKVMQTTANVPPTDDEMEIIKKELSANHPDYWEFQLVQFHTGIRPFEIIQIKVNMIDKKTKTLVLPPEITKTGKERSIAINPHLWKVIEKRLSFPDDYYLFGTFAPAKGYKRHHKYFIPGPNRLTRKHSTNYWEEVVKKGLGINKNQYAMKKAGANAKIIAGMSIRTLKELFGHNSELTTEIYITNLKERINQEIIELSPEL